MFKFADYRLPNGSLALSSEIHIRDMPMPTGLSYPEELRREAQLHASRLADVFEALGEELRVQRDLVSGQRLDPRKRHDIGLALRRGEVDPNQIRPYMRREVTLTGLPKITLVASVGVYECNADHTLVDRLTQLSLIIAWACENIGMEVDAVLMEGHGADYLSPNQPYREAQLAYVLVEAGRFTPLQAYNVTRNTSILYSVGFKGALEADEKALTRMAKLQGKRSIKWYQGYPGYNGGRGVYWARQHRQADLVIGIGKLTDIAEADIQLANSFSIQQAVDEIARQTRALLAS